MPLGEAYSEILKVAAEIQSDPRRFKVYKNNPVGFAEEVLGIPRLVIGKTPAEDVIGLTDEQVAILTAMVRDQRITIRSGHSLGKSFVMAVAALWWLLCREGLVVTTSTSWLQTAQVLWGAIERLHRDSRVALPGRFTADPPELRIERGWYGIGLNAERPDGFQGRHHRYLLVLIDEAAGVPDNVHEAIESLATGSANCVVQVGNPTNARGFFADSFQLDGYTKFHLSCLNHPNVVQGREIIPGAVTREWVERQRERYGEDSPVWYARVIGEFPTEGVRQLIPTWSVDQAMEPDRWAAALAKAKGSRERIILSLDVARYGDNASVLCVRRGDVIESIEGWRDSSTVDTAARAARAYHDVGGHVIVVDGVGVGGGVVDLLVGDPGIYLVDFHAGRRAQDHENFHMARSESWWHLREKLQAGTLALPWHATLKSDLISLNYSYTAKGQITVQRKDQLESLGIPSPDYGDSVMMAYAMDFEPLPPPPPALDDSTRDPTVFTPYSERQLAGDAPLSPGEMDMGYGGINF